MSCFLPPLCCCALLLPLGGRYSADSSKLFSYIFNVSHILDLKTQGEQRITNKMTASVKLHQQTHAGGMCTMPPAQGDVVWEVCVGEEPEVMGDGVFIILAPYLERKAECEDQ